MVGACPTASQCIYPTFTSSLSYTRTTQCVYAFYSARSGFGVLHLSSAYTAPNQPQPPPYFARTPPAHNNNIITQLGGGSIYNFSGSHSHCADFCLNQFEFGKLLEIIILAKHLDSLTTKIIKYHLTV